MGDRTEQADDQTPSPHILGAAARKKLKRADDGKLYVVVGDKAFGPVNEDGTIDGQVEHKYTQNAQGGTDCTIYLPCLQVVPKAHLPGKLDKEED